MDDFYTAKPTPLRRMKLTPLEIECGYIDPTGKWPEAKPTQAEFVGSWLVTETDPDTDTRELRRRGWERKRALAASMNERIAARVFNEGFCPEMNVATLEELQILKFKRDRIARRIGPSVEQACKAMACMAHPDVTLVATDWEAVHTQRAIDRAFGFDYLPPNPMVGNRLMHLQMTELDD